MDKESPAPKEAAAIAGRESIRMSIMDAQNEGGVLVQLDERRRVVLGKVGRHSRYLVHEEPDGTLVFVPAVVMTELQRELLSRPDDLAQLEEAIENRAERGVPWKRPKREGTERD